MKKIARKSSVKTISTPKQYLKTKEKLELITPEITQLEKLIKEKENSLYSLREEISKLEDKLERLEEKRDDMEEDIYECSFYYKDESPQTLISRACFELGQPDVDVTKINSGKYHVEDYSNSLTKSLAKKLFSYSTNSIFTVKEEVLDLTPEFYLLAKKRGTLKSSLEIYRKSNERIERRLVVLVK